MSEAMQLAEFKKRLHGEMQTATLSLLPRLYDMLSFTEDPEILRKSIQMFVQTVGAEAEKKQDPYGNLPVVHISFSNGTMSSQTTLPAIEIEAKVLDTLQPTPAMRKRSTVNADVDFDDEDMPEC